ncbi:hypothetical protein ACFQ9X_13260 [Catenulispora yoronensis]
MVGLAVGGPAGALLGGAAGSVIPEVIKAMDAFQERAGESANLVASHVAELTGLSPVDLHLWAVGDERRLSLTAATMQAAFSSLDKTKLRALARVLAEAVEDDARLDLATLITASLADLEPSHIRVLRAMCTETPPKTWEESVARGAWLYSALRVRFPNLGEGILPIMATLVRHGMADGSGLAGTTPAGMPDDVWSITDYGRSVFSFLGQASVDDE